LNAEHQTLIKICGITRAEDGLAALRAGANWLGFIRWPGSPRFREAEDCARTIEEIRSSADRPFEAVGVYVNPAPVELYEDSMLTGVDRAQLHGDEAPDYVSRLPLPVIKTIRIRDEDSLRRADDYPEMALLTDTHDPALPGGTGRSYDPALLVDLVRRRRVLVAGGLTPASVVGVVRFLRPFGVDVSSGVEQSPGIKDHQKIADFVAAVREGDGG
jgi:phosphoribosylanthranilate isomerase